MSCNKTIVQMYSEVVIFIIIPTKLPQPNMLVQPNSTCNDPHKRRALWLYVCEHTKANRAEKRIKQEEIEIETKQHTQHNCLWEQAQRDHVFHKEGQSSTTPAPYNRTHYYILHFSFSDETWIKKERNSVFSLLWQSVLGKSIRFVHKTGGKNRQSISFDSLKSKYYCPISRWTVNRERTKSQKKGGQREMGAVYCI